MGRIRLARRAQVQPAPGAGVVHDRASAFTSRQEVAELRVLGPVEVWEGDSRLDIGGPRQRALLALLVLDGGPVSATRIADELWEGNPPPRAEATLRSYISRLRRVLGRDAIAADAGAYRVVTDIATDAGSFESLQREGHAALEAGDAARASERLSAALALWRGDALADVATGGALAAEARRLDELRIVCLADRLDADLSLGRHVELVPELRALVDRYPHRERLWRLLVLALYRAQRQADALAAYREARDTLDRELGVEPGEELRLLELAILRHDVEPPTGTKQRALPLVPTSFVGRARELAELELLLRRHHLVTVTGLGGAGKTRLALELAHTRATSWLHGVRLVDLSVLADPALVTGAVAAALDLDDSARDAVVERLRPLEVLLVVDNCEHVAAAAAGLIDELLRTCPRLRILATSRASLGVEGEVDYALDALDAESARSLFVQRADAVRSGAADDAAAIDVICRELDGLPLAIELAAARVRALSPSEIAARLDDRFRFLRAWQRLADPRHRTLQAAMDWSYDLLGKDERTLLQRLAVFAGGAELDAVAAVCLDGDETAALDLLERLVDASLVRAEPLERTRYRLLETVRQYAAAKLADDPHADAVRRCHADYFLALADAANLSIEAVGRGPQQLEAVLREQHNMRAALDWAVAADHELALRLMVALENFWITQAVVEGAARYAELLPLCESVDATLRARAMRDYAACTDVQRDYVAAQARYEESRRIFAEAGDDLGVAYLDYRLGIMAYLQQDPDTAKRLYTASLDAFRRYDNKALELQVLGSLGRIELAHGDRTLGRELAQQSIAMANETGYRWWVARYEAWLADEAISHGDVDEGSERTLRFLRYSSRAGSRQDVLWGLALAARAAGLRGETERALALWATVDAVEDRPERFGQFDRASYAADIPDGPLPPPLPLEAAVELALRG